MKSPIVVYIFLVMILTLLPLNSFVPSVTGIRGLRPSHLFHVAMFLPWAWLGMVSRKKEPHWLGWGALLATISEALHLLLAYRSFAIADLVANAIGLALGYGIYLRKHILGYRERP